MSLRRFNKIILRTVKLIFNSRIQLLTKSQIAPKLIPNVLPRVGIPAPKQSRFVLRRTLFRNLRTLRHRHPLLRPFATLHFQHNRLREFERTRGLLLLQVPRKKDVLERVRHIFGTNIRYNRALAVTEMPNNLDAYEIGPFIASGCNGAVHALRIRSDEGHVGPEYPLALKIMFNYNFCEPEHVLWTQMGTELVPLPSLPKRAFFLNGRMSNIKTLPRPHPNIIKIHTAFVDRMPILPGADHLYPDALPNMNDYELRNEPKTLHVVMKRYRMTLHDYLIANKRRVDLWKGRIMFGQLLEAILFLHQNKICHRDMKSDNILLDFNDADETPHLILSDFGSALATGAWTVRYNDDTVDLGGNIALRPPEIRRISPGPDVSVNFEMADTWAAGTLAYEIFTGRNPFYHVLSSEKYSEKDLPPLPLGLIDPIKWIVGQMLSTNPRDRPWPAISANVVAISLLRFGHDIRTFLRSCGVELSWLPKRTLGRILSKINEPVEHKLREMAELYATETILLRLIDPAKISKAELQLRATFLSRVDTSELRLALAYFAGSDESFTESAHSIN